MPEPSEQPGVDQPPRPRVANSEECAALAEILDTFEIEPQHSGQIIDGWSQGKFKLDDGTVWKGALVQIAVGYSARLSEATPLSRTPVDPVPGDFRVIDCKVFSPLVVKIIESVEAKVDRYLEKLEGSPDETATVGQIWEDLIQAMENNPVYEGVFVECNHRVVEVTEPLVPGAVYEHIVGQIGFDMVTDGRPEVLDYNAYGRLASGRMVRQLTRHLQRSSGGGIIFSRFNNAQ